MATPAKQCQREAPIIESFMSHELPEHWERGRIIGSGASGKIHLVVDNDNPSQEMFVVKDMFITERDKDSIAEQFRTETTILRTSETHPRIVHFYGYRQEENTFSIFLQYLKNGSLSDYLYKSGKLPEPKIQLFTRQILEAVVFLHDNNIIHRDIKGRNILLEDEDNIRLTDFGISKILKDVTSTGSAGIGTCRWMAPEVFIHDDSAQKYNKKVDVWSIGCTVVEMITGEDPYHECNREPAVLVKIMNKQPPQYKHVPVSVSCENFLTKAFTVDFCKRPTAKDLLYNDEFIINEQTGNTLKRDDEYVLVIKQNCRKNRDHKDFFPVNMFSMSHLPTSFQDNELFELIKAISELTVMITLNHISHARTEVSAPEISGQQSYYLHRSAGTDFLRLASGMIDFENFQNFTDKCNCDICQTSDSPENAGIIFNVITATHVAFDNSEAKTIKCTLYYNDDKSKHVTVFGLSVVSADTTTDRCVIKCVSHDMTLLEHLSKAWERYKDLNTIVTGRYRHQRKTNKLCVIVSHPHGATKCVTVGEWVKRDICGTAEQVHLPLTRYYYTTATCGGSSGAPVFIPGIGVGKYHHTHSGWNGNYNFSGLFLD